MPNSTLLQLRQKIKFEGRIEGDDTFNTYVDTLINELINVETQSGLYPELKVLTEITVVPSGLHNLPADYMIFHKVLYQRNNPLFTYKLDPRDGIVQPSPLAFPTGPNSYDIVGSKIQLNPIAALSAADKLILSYYKAHINLIADTDVILIARMEPIIIRNAVARIHMWHNKLEAASAITQTTQKLEAVTNAINQVATNDPSATVGK